jgi:hypothetical protein
LLIWRPSRRARIVGCGLVAVVVSVAAIGVKLNSGDWNLTVLPQVGSKTRMAIVAKALDPGFRTARAGGYDGQFYWGVAIDPLATGSVHRAFDKASYRYGHPLYGWISWLLSADSARRAPAALAIVGLGAMFAAAAAATALGIARGRAGWEGLFVALNAGLIISSSEDLAEPLGAALLLGVFAALASELTAVAWACLALLPVAKEQLFVVIIAVSAYELLHAQRRRAAFFAAAAIPSLVWWIYARIQLGAWFTTGDSALGPPALGWWRALTDPGVRVHGLLARHGSEGIVVVGIFVALLLALALGGFRALFVRGPVELTYLGLMALAICLAANATVALSTALRNTAFLVTLIPFVVFPPAVLLGRGRRRGQSRDERSRI